MTPPEDPPPGGPEDGGPPDPITELAAGAAQIHELFAAYLVAGFTRMEAMQLVIAILNRPT